MSEYAKLVISVDSTQARKADKDLGALEKSASSLTSGLGKMIGPLVSVATAMAALNKASDVQRQFDVLNAGLITATGSSEKAAQAFKALQSFAQKTPYDLNQAVKGFTQLVNLGLTPSEKALTAYGNTASAMGKDLNQMIEAVADAATGEFERLKEFGIKAKTSGNDISLTFQGVTTKIGNNASEIEKYLTALGENQFAGAMQLRMNTLDGAVANLGDTWDTTFRLINEAGLGDIMQQSVRDVTASLDELNAMLASGEMEGYLEASAVAWSGWSRDVTESVDTVSVFLNETWGDWGDGAKDASKGMYLGFKEFPAEIRAYFQEAAVEAIAFVDRLIAQGAYAKDAIAAVFNDSTLNDARKRYDATVSISNQVRQDMIDDISQEKDATINAANEKIESSKGLRREYNLQQKAAAALTGDRLAQYKAKGDGSSASSSAAVDKAAKAAQSLVDTQEKAIKSFLATTAITTSSTNAMADAYLAGADNVRELTIQQKIEEELLKTGAGARDAVTAAVNREADAKDRLDITQSIADMRIETTQTLAQATATLQGKTALEAFNIQKSMTVALAGKNIEVGSKEYQLLLDQTKAQLDANKALEQAGEVEGIVDRLNPQIKLLKDYTAEQDALNAAIARYPENAALYQDALAKLGREYEVNQSKATIWGQLTEGAIDRIDGVFADAWANIGSGANNLWDSLVKGAKQAFGEIAHMLTTKPLLASISNWLTGTDNGQGLSSVWGKLLGSATGQQGGSGGGMAGMGSNLVSMGKSIYQAYSAITGVGSSVASGYASGGISGALSGGASYYGNMLSSISSTLSNGFTSLASTITGTAAVQTAATIGAQGASSALLSGAVTEGAAAVGAQFTTGVATTSAATYAAAEAGAAATAASLGGQISAAVSSAAAMWPLAVIMGMYQSGKLYDAGVRPDAGEIMDSGGKTVLGKVAMAPGAAMSGFFEAQDKALSKVVGGKWAAILSGSTLHQAVTKYVGEKLFGGSWQTKNSGITLGVENGQLEGQQFVDQKKKGGLFSSSKKRTRYSALDAQTAESLSAVYDATEQGVIALVSRIGISANEGTFDGLNIAKSKLSTKGKTGEEVQKLVSDWFSSASDQMVGFLDGGTGGFGYSFAELAQRIASFETFNGTLDTLNIAVLGLSPHSMELANSLIAAAGGMEAFQTATNTYYDNFFSEAEKADDTLAAVTKQFAAMGVTLPGTRDAYRDMVEALDMTTASGQSMFMTLTGLAGNAAQAYSILEQRAGAAAESAAAAADAATAAAKELADALKEALMSSVSSAMSAVQRAISAQQKAATDAYNATTASLNDRVNTATENVAGLTAVGNDLSAALKELRGDSDDAVKMLRVQAQATLQSALVKARSGGSLSGLAGLEDALDTVSNNNTELYGSLEDFARDQGRTANVVAELNGINGKQLTASEKSLKGLETQIELAKKAYDAQMTSFDSQLAFAQSQLDALNGVDTSVLSVAAAVQQMNAAVVAALAGQAAGAAMKNTTDNNVALLESVYQAVLGRGLDGNGLATWTAALANGSVTYENLAQTIATGGRLNGETVKIPGFANGGEYGGGLRLVGERGPELEVTGPSRIYNASQTAAMLSGGGQDTANEVRQLRAELKSALFAIAKNTLKSARNTELLPQKLEQELFA